MMNLISLFCTVNLMDQNLLLFSHPSPDFSDWFSGWFDVLQRALHEAFEVISRDPEGKPKSRWGKLHYLLWKMWCHVPTAQRSSAQRQLKQMGGRTRLNWFHIIRFTNTSRAVENNHCPLFVALKRDSSPQKQNSAVLKLITTSGWVRMLLPFLISCHLKLLTSVCCLVCHLRRLRREDTEVYKIHFILLPYESQKVDVTVFSPQRAAHIYRKFNPPLKKQISLWHFQSK